MNLIHILAELKVKVTRLHNRGILDLDNLDVTIGVQATHLGWEIYMIKPNQLTLWKE